MKRYLCALLIAFVALFAFSCKKEPRNMTAEDYVKIQTEVNLPDPALDPQMVEKVASKYGYSYEDYKTFNDKVEKDPQLREKLGGLKMKTGEKAESEEK